jgi:hypothetical protein
MTESINKPYTNQHILLNKLLFSYLKKNNIFNDLDETNYIKTYKKELSKVIDSSTYSDATKKNIYFMIARFLSVFTNDQRYNIMYSRLGYELKQKLENKEALNELDEKEKESHKEHNFFINILSSIDYEKINNYDDHLKYLILSLLTKTPLLRSNFYITCQIITNVIDNDKINNFILITKNKCSYIVNNDKVSNTKLYSSNQQLSIIDIDSQLNDLLNYSIKIYPRNYLFENQKTKLNVSNVTLLDYLKDITGLDGIDINIMRSVYITNAYKNSSLNDKKILSYRMRHTIGSQQLYYNKIIDNEEPKTNENYELLKNKLSLVELELKKNNKILDEYKQLPENKKLFNKRKNDILYKLNNGYNSKKSTINKYNISFINGKYQ